MPKRIDNKKLYKKSKSGMTESKPINQDQSSDSAKSASPTKQFDKSQNEDQKDFDASFIKSEKSLFAKDNIARTQSIGTFLGEGCASFLSQPSLIAKLTRKGRLSTMKIVYLTLLYIS